MSELAGALREAIDELARRDRTLNRFGAATHRYALAPPLAEAEVAALERALGTDLPADYRSFLVDVSAGGAGPAYGLFPAGAAVRAAIRQQNGPWHLALPLAHFGCGYAIVLALDGRARGQIWLHARTIDFVATIHPSFTAWYLAWVERAARGELPDGIIPAGTCALPIALSRFFAICEQRRGLAAGTLAGEALREALGQLGPGAIELAADAAQPLFDPDDRVDPCITCARLVTSLATDGLDPRVLAPGVAPHLVRTSDKSPG